MNRKWLIIILIAAISLLITGYLVLEYVAHQRLPKILGEKARVEVVDIDLLSNNVIFKCPSLVIDSINDAPELKIHARANYMYISGFSIWDLLMSKKIGVHDFTIDSAVVAIQLPDIAPTPSEKEGINLLFKEIFTRIEVENFSLENSSILVFKQENKDSLLMINNLNINAQEILIEKGIIGHTFPLHFERSVVRIDSIYLKASKNYSLHTGNLTIEDTSLHITNFHLIPNYDKSTFAANQKYEKARLDLSVDTLHLKNLLWELDQSGWLSLNAKKAILSGLYMNIHKDKRPPQGPLTTRPLLTGHIMELPFSLTVDSLTVQKGFIEYEENPTKFPRAGRIFFKDTYVHVHNITNDSVAIHENAITTVNIKTKFMNMGRFEAVIMLNMADPNQGFYTKGHLGTMPFTYINQALAPLTGATAKGNLQEMKFQMEGNDYQAKGSLQMAYTDLNIEIYDKKREKDWLTSLVGNLILKTKNGSDDPGTYKEGEIYFIRYRNKGFFNQVWNGLRVGMMDIIVPFYKNPDKENPPSTPKYKMEDLTNNIRP